MIRVMIRAMSTTRKVSSEARHVPPVVELNIKIEFRMLMFREDDVLKPDVVDRQEPQASTS
jgi:hypothetical protein